MTTRFSSPPTPVIPYLVLPDPGAPDDYEPLPDAMKQEPFFTETMQVVRTFFLGRSAALVSGDSPIYYDDEEGVQQIVRPDCYVAFDVDEEAIRRRNGYFLRDVGRSPDFALEIASESTHTEDTGRKREIYARLGISEYWRFDNTGGEFYPEPLAGELLAGGEYRPIEMQQNPEGIIWGRSPALGLDLCWYAGRLRFYDPVTGSYLRNLTEAEAEIDSERAAHDDAESRADVEAVARRDAESRADAEAAARRDAESRADVEAVARRDAESRADVEAVARRDAESRADVEAVARRDAETAREADRARIRQLEEELRRWQSER